MDNSNDGNAGRRALLRMGLGGALALAAAASGGPVPQSGVTERPTGLPSAATPPLPRTLPWPQGLTVPRRPESTPARELAARHPWHRPAFYVRDLLPDAPRNAIALTIDDGPHPLYTPMVLEALRAHGVKATFSMIGINVQLYPQTARQVVAEGHSICNHSMFHPIPFTILTQAQIHREVAEAMNRIWDATRVTPRLFRSPGGEWSPTVFRILATYDLAPLDWDVDPRDWALPGVAHVEEILDSGRGGDILLCHDGGGNRIETVRALHHVIPALLARKLEFVTLLTSGRAPFDTTSAAGSGPRRRPHLRYVPPDCGRSAQADRRCGRLHREYQQRLLQAPLYESRRARVRAGATRLTGRQAPPLPTPSVPPVSAACRTSAGPHPAAPVLAATRKAQVPRLQELIGRPPRAPASCYRESPQSRALSGLASLTRWRFAPPWSVTSPAISSAPLRRTGVKPSVPSLASHQSRAGRRDLGVCDTAFPPGRPSHTRQGAAASSDVKP